MDDSSAQPVNRYKTPTGINTFEESSSSHKKSYLNLLNQNGPVSGIGRGNLSTGSSTHSTPQGSPTSSPSQSPSRVRSRSRSRSRSKISSPNVKKKPFFQNLERPSSPCVTLRRSHRINSPQKKSTSRKRIRSHSTAQFWGNFGAMGKSKNVFQNPMVENAFEHFQKELEKSYGMVENLKKRNASLLSDNEKLITSVSYLSEELKRVEVEKGDMEVKFSDLKTQNNNLKIDNVELKQELRELQESRERFEDSLKKVSGNNQRLKKRLEKASAKKNTFKRQLSESTIKIGCLNRAHSNLKKQLSSKQLISSRSFQSKVPHRRTEVGLDRKLSEKLIFEKKKEIARMIWKDEKNKSKLFRIKNEFETLKCDIIRCKLRCKSQLFNFDECLTEVVKETTFLLRRFLVEKIRHSDRMKEREVDYAKIQSQAIKDLGLTKIYERGADESREGYVWIKYCYIWKKRYICANFFKNHLYIYDVNRDLINRVSLGDCSIYDCKPKVFIMNFPPLKGKFPCKSVVIVKAPSERCKNEWFNFISNIIKHH